MRCTCTERVQTTAGGQAWIETLVDPLKPCPYHFPTTNDD